MSFWKKKDNLIITGLVVLFFAGLSVWFDLCCVRAAFFHPVAVEDPFEIPFLDEDQKQLTLDQFKGKPVVVYFWATWCSVCVKKMGTLNSFAKKFKEKGGEVLPISQDKGGISTVRAYYDRHHYENLKIYIESMGHLMDAFGGRGLPTAVFIDAQGKPVAQIEGGIDWESSDVKEMVKKHFGIQLP